MKVSRAMCLGLTAAALLVPSALGAALPPGKAVSAASNCARTMRLQLACGLVSRFFRAVNSRRYEEACAALGVELRAETGGAACPAFIGGAVPEPVPWAIRGGRVTSDGASVTVTVGQFELGHYRMREWVAVVRDLNGRSLIVATQLVA